MRIVVADDAAATTRNTTMSQPIYSVKSDLLLSSPETETENLLNFTRCTSVLGKLDVVSDTVKYVDCTTAAEGARFHGKSAREMLAQLPPTCDLFFDRGAVRARIFKVGVRRYAPWQKTTAALFAALAIACAVIALVFVT